MRKETTRFLSFLLSLVMVIAIVPAFTASVYADYTRSTWAGSNYVTGEGSMLSPYSISSYAQLTSLANVVNAYDDFDNVYIKLADSFPTDSGELTVPIGTATKPFSGTFDGNGKTVNLNITTAASVTVYVGMFGFTSGASISNVSVDGTVDTTVSGNPCLAYTGALVGYVSGGSIINCFSTVKVTGSSIGNSGIFIGGLIGKNGVSSSIMNCYAVGSLYAYGGYLDAGGLVGGNAGTIANCYFTGTINATVTTAGFAGGIAGLNTNIAMNCYCLDSNENIIGKNTSGTAINCLTLSAVQMQAGSGFTEADGETWKEITVSSGCNCSKSSVKLSLTDALNDYVKGNNSNGERYWGVMNQNVNEGYPIFGLNTPIYLNGDKAYSANTFSDYYEIPMPEGITYSSADGVNTYTFKNVAIPSWTENYLSICTDATIVLQGENQIGVNGNTESMSDISIYSLFGIFTTNKLIVTGNGSLITYGCVAGVYAKDITFDSNFDGKYTSFDYGWLCSGVCGCLDAADTVTIKNGTFDLTDTTSYAIHAPVISISGEDTVVNATSGAVAIGGGPDAETTSITIDESTINAYGAKQGICAFSVTSATSISISGSSINSAAGRRGIYAYSASTDASISIRKSTVKSTAQTGNSDYYGIFAYAGGAGLSNVNIYSSTVNAIGYFGIGSHSLQGRAKLNALFGNITANGNSRGLYAQSGGSGDVETCYIFSNVTAKGTDYGIFASSASDSALLMISGSNVNASATNASAIFAHTYTSDASIIINGDSNVAASGNECGILGVAGEECEISVYGDDTVVKAKGVSFGAIAVYSNTYKEFLDIDTDELAISNASSYAINYSGRYPMYQTGLTYSTSTVAIQNVSGKYLTIKKASSSNTPVYYSDGESTTVTTKPAAQTRLSPFVDVEKDEFYYDAVNWAVDKGITDGVDETHFAPSGITTRAQMVTFLWRAAGSPVVNYAMKFTDIPDGQYYTEAVRWAASTGVTKGTSATTFSPGDQVTRAQTVAFLWRYEGSTVQTGAANPFIDILTGQYYYDAVLWAKENMITDGTSVNRFSPDDPCTRGQIVTFLYRDLSD